MAAAYLGEAPRLVLLACGLVIAIRVPPSWLGHAPMVVLALLLLGGLVGPAYGWGSRRYAVTSTGLTEVRGLFRIQTRSLAWRDISSVEVLAPWNARPFGLRVVVLGADGSADSTIRIEGVPVADAEDISQSARLGHRGPRGGEDPARVQTSRSQAPADEDRIHRSSSLDLIISSLCYGQAVVLAGAVVGAAVQIMELAGHSAEVVQALATRPGPVLALLCLVGLTAGAVLTAVRFHGLTVAVEDGRTVLRHGLISTTTRIIGRDQVVGVQVRRNLVEMLLDRARVSLITADSSQQWDSNLALPSLSRRRILVLMARLTPGARIPPPLVAPGPAVLPVSLALALLPVAAGSAVAWGAAQWWPGRALMAMAVGAVVLLLGLLMTRWCAARLDTGDAEAGVLAWSTELGGQTIRLLRCSAVHVLTTAHVPGRRGLRLITVHYHSGMPRACPALTTSSDASEAITRAVGEAGPRIALHRTRGKAASCSSSTA